MSPDSTRAPLVPVAGAFVAGLGLVELTGPVGTLAPFFLAAPLLLGALVFSSRRKLLQASGLVFAAFVLLGFGAASVRGLAAFHRTLLPAFSALGEKTRLDPALVVGRLREEPSLSADSTIFTVDSETVTMARRVLRAEGGLRVRVNGDKRELLRDLGAGDRIRFWGRLAEPTDFGNPGGFDGRRFRERERIDLVSSVKSALLVDVESRGASIAAIVSKSRLASVARIETSLTPSTDPASIGVVIALTTGDRSRLQIETERTYRAAGVFHVIAISGAHVAIVILALYFALRRLGGVDEPPSIVLLLAVLPLYALFCGSGPPVVRAVLVAAVVLGARLMSLDSSRGNALALALLILLAFDPAFLSDPGFQLTFAAMAAILWLSPPLGESLARLGPLAQPLAISIAAQAGVIPITAWHFHSLTPVGPLASLVAIPLAGIVVVLGLVLVAVAGIPGLAGLVAAGVRIAVWLLSQSAELASSLPGGSFAIPRPSLLWLVSYVALLVLGRHGPRRWRLVFLLSMTGILLAPLRDVRTARGTLELTALDVGHGDALVLTLPQGQRLLIDGGGIPGSSFDVGERVVLPYLLDHGGRRIDALVSTHSDFDHLAGLLAIVEWMNVVEIWEGTPSEEKPLYRRLREVATRRGVPFRRLRAGERFEWGGARFEILAAGETEAAEENERSLVFRVSAGKARMLFTGDAGRPVEEALLASSSDRLDADVLKVGHHGSNSSTSVAFLRAVSPRLAVLSVRGGASRPLPAPSVLERLRELDVEFLRTDEWGAVTVRLDAEANLEIETFRSPRRGER